MDHPILKKLPSLKKEIRELLVSLKQLRRDYKEAGDDESPHIFVTIGCTFDFDENEISWNYQTGDNSSKGDAYSHPQWFNVYLTSRSNCTTEAADVIDEISSRIHEILSNKQV
jgi:hypothetical protein